MGADGNECSILCGTTERVLGIAGTQLVNYFETQCLDLPAYGSSALPESEWLSDVLEQVG